MPHNYTVSQRSGESIPNCDLGLPCDCGRPTFEEALSDSMEATRQALVAGDQRRAAVGMFRERMLKHAIEAWGYRPEDAEIVVQRIIDHHDAPMALYEAGFEDGANQNHPPERKGKSNQ